MQQNEPKEKSPLKKRIIRIAIGLIIGALLGYAYYYFVGCHTGSCPLTSKPLNSILSGMILGAIWTIK